MIRFMCPNSVQNDFTDLFYRSSEDLVIEFEVYETWYLWRVSSPFPLRQWIHVTCVWHRFLGMKLYVNAVLMAQLSNPKYHIPTVVLPISEENSLIALVNSTDAVTIYLDELYIETVAWDPNRPLKEYGMLIVSKNVLSF